MVTAGEAVTASGRSIKLSARYKTDSKDYPVTGSPTADSVAIKVIDDRTHEFTFKRDGKVISSGRNVLAKDGKTYTSTSEGVDTQGRQVHNVVVFEKQ